MYIRVPKAYNMAHLCFAGSMEKSCIGKVRQVPVTEEVGGTVKASTVPSILIPYFKQSHESCFVSGKELPFLHLIFVVMILNVANCPSKPNATKSLPFEQTSH